MERVVKERASRGNNSGKNESKTLEIYKPGEGIPSKGLKPENMRRFASLQMKATIKV